jgi:hypothetical protein
MAEMAKAPGRDIFGKDAGQRIAEACAAGLIAKKKMPARS